MKMMTESERREKLKEMKEARELLICKISKLMKESLTISEIANKLHEPESRIHYFVHMVIMPSINN